MNGHGQVAVRATGEFALFTRPEMKVERVSYDVITPSAARGLLEAVLWKPQMRWVINRIVVLAPIRYAMFKRNEVASKVPATAVGWAAGRTAPTEFFADDDRQQRNTLALRDVDYLIHASIELTKKAGADDTRRKYEEMFVRRVEKGQHFHQPYFGCREFAASVWLPDGSETVPDELRGVMDLGWVLHDIDFGAANGKRPRFFHAVMQDGVLDVPAFETEVTQ